MVLFVVALLVGVVCAVSQALSAMLARSITSALLSYVTVFALSLGTLLAFGLALPLSGGGYYGRTATTASGGSSRPNPFVVLADSAPQVPMKRDPKTGRLEAPPVGDPLGEIGRGVRQMRFSPEERRAYYDSYDGSGEWPTSPVWPYGLAFNLLLGAGSVMIVRRLRTPVRQLTKGTRIA